MLADVNLLHKNSVQYNGESHAVTATALKIVKICEEQFEEHAEQFDALERNIQQQTFAVQQSNDDDWQQMMTTDITTSFAFHPLIQGKLYRQILSFLLIGGLMVLKNLL
jgi:hypothetical protein